MDGRVSRAACSLALCLATSVAAQGTRNAILETPAARLELIGLKRWTLGMIQDPLARYAPGESLASHACAAILRQKLGFADAAAQYYSPSPGSTKGYWAVPVVEPQDSARVRYRELPRDSLPTVRSGRQLSSLSGSAIRSFSPQSRHLRSCSAGCTQTASSRDSRLRDRSSNSCGRIAPRRIEVSPSRHSPTTEAPATAHSPPW